MHSLTAYHDKMESLPKGWKSVRHGLYANDSTGGVWEWGKGPLYPGRAGAKPPCQCELQKQQFAESSGRSPCNHFTLYSADSKVTKNKFFELRVDASEGEREVGGVVLEVRDGVCLSIHIYESTCTASINHRERYCCKADIPIFIKIHAVRV